METAACVAKPVVVFGAAEYMFRWEQQEEYMERRRLYLRSYHFSRNRPAGERARGTLLRVRRLVWVRLREARRLPRILWAKLRRALASLSAGRRRRNHHGQFHLLPHRRAFKQ
ncbi:uncharacterized protein LOC122016497 [Zingiber officinale]|uniref:Uncharacterized protein n=1 Tax=Zingiber officinale TaxID=94328 RepID=A0A8J5F9Z8_ZINOF|nr:uncharacterized protein LOC122016497 [Zingiber officinale]KAG6482965.1 hypothetical protein ZIOFF_059605 [Zingiber officinale]